MDDLAHFALYRSLPRSTRSGPLFNAVSYPTKIAPETAALFIASHTAPGGLVVDGFGGSGTTALGALLCARPTPAMLAEAARLRLPVAWGPRRALVSELSGIGAFIGQTLSMPPDPVAFRRAAEEVLDAVDAACGWMYDAPEVTARGRRPLAGASPGALGTIRYAIWSEVLCCPSCGAAQTLWDAAVSLGPARMADDFRCARCAARHRVDNTPRATEAVFDDVLGRVIERRVRRLVRVHGVTSRRTWTRAAATADRDLADVIEAAPLPDAVPRTAIPWGDLYRAGYHAGITHLHHFYTRRNVIALGHVWDACRAAPTGPLGDALRLWALSYNASHGTLMTRVVAKRGASDFVVTGAQPGVLYVSGLPVEKNVLLGLRRKLNVLAAAFAAVRETRPAPGGVRVVRGSSERLDLPNGAADYVFTDPPFGGNIPYAEVNFVSEAWLGCVTDPAREAIVSPAQGKGMADYEALLAACLGEMSRVLRDGAPMTVVFHSARARVWNALLAACARAGLAVERASVLDKTQGSFKQVTTRGAVKGDPTLLLSKRPVAEGSHADALPPAPVAGAVSALITSAERANGAGGSAPHSGGSQAPCEDWREVTRGLVDAALATGDSAECTPQRLFSRLVTHYVARHAPPPVDALEFYNALDTSCPRGAAGARVH